MPCRHRVPADDATGMPAVTVAGSSCWSFFVCLSYHLLFNPSFVSRQKKHMNDGMPEEAAFETTRREYETLHNLLKEQDTNTASPLLAAFLTGAHTKGLLNLFNDQLVYPLTDKS
jgi:hypothetical protein